MSTNNWRSRYLSLDRTTHNKCQWTTPSLRLLMTLPLFFPHQNIWIWLRILTMTGSLTSKNNGRGLLESSPKEILSLFLAKNLSETQLWSMSTNSSWKLLNIMLQSIGFYHETTKERNPQKYQKNLYRTIFRKSGSRTWGSRELSWRLRVPPYFSCQFNFSNCLIAKASVISFCLLGQLSQNKKNTGKSR